MSLSLLEIQQQVARGVTILQQGGIVAFPTDTVYGLGASARLEPAVARVYAVKRRPPDKPLPLLLADIAQISLVAEPVPPLAWRLIHRFLPGALTIVLPRAASVPDFLTAGGTTIAIRVPAHPVPVALVRGLGAPIVGTSANLSGEPSPLTARRVRSQLGNEIDFIIEGGQRPGGRASTIVDATGEKPVVLREGAISTQDLKQVCANIVVREG